MNRGKSVYLTSFGHGFSIGDAVPGKSCHHEALTSGCPRKIRTVQRRASPYRAAGVAAADHHSDEPMFYRAAMNVLRKVLLPKPHNRALPAVYMRNCWGHVYLVRNRLDGYG